MHLYYLKRWVVIKVIAILLIIAFSYQQIAWANGDSPLWSSVTSQQAPSPDSAIKIPNSLGKVQESVVTSNGDTVIHIQDAHASLSAQRSIVQILDRLVSDYKVNMIALEGASGYVNTSILKTFPDKKIRNETAEYLMEEGEISAGDFFSVTRDNDNILLYGIDDDKLYKENLKYFTQMVEKGQSYLAEVAKIKNRLNLISEKAFSDEIKKFEQDSELHKKGRISFSEYWKKISAYPFIRSLQIDRYPNIHRLVSAIELENRIDFDKATDERKRLVDSLRDKVSKEELKEVLRQIVQFKSDEISQMEFNLYLARLAEQHGLDPAQSGNFIAFTKYISVYSSIDIVALYRETSSIEDEIRKALYTSNEQRELHKWMNLCAVLESLYKIEVDSDEFSLFLNGHRREIDAAACRKFIDNESRKYGITKDASIDIRHAFSGIDEAMGLYNAAEKRNKAMIDNTIKMMRARGKHTAALITGGYHTRGLTELLRENRLSYLIVTPKFENGKERPYITVLTNKKRPYEELAKTGKYQLAVMDYFKTMDEEKFFKMAIRAFSGVLADGGDWKKDASVWYATYRDEYEAAAARDPEEVKGCLKPDEVKKILGLGEYDGKGQIFFNIFEGDVYACRLKTDGRIYYQLALNKEDGKPLFREMPSDEGGNVWTKIGQEPKGLATILPLKEIIAPKMDLKKYSVKVAPIVEEILFLALPIFLSQNIFGLGWAWSLVVMLAVRSVFFHLHEGARSTAPPEYETPRDVAIYGFLASIPVLIGASISYTPILFAATVVLMMLAHSAMNEEAIRLGKATASIKKRGGSGQLLLQLEYNRDKFQKKVFSELKLEINKIQTFRIENPRPFSQAQSPFITDASQTLALDQEQGINDALSEYFGFILDDVMALCQKYDIALDKKRLTEYMKVVISEADIDARANALAKFEKIRREEEPPIELSMGSIGALAAADMTNNKYQIDIGMLLYLAKRYKNPAISEILTAVILNRLFIGNLMKPPEDEMYMKYPWVRLAKNDYECMTAVSKRAEQLTKAQFDKIIAVFSNLFSTVRSSNDIPFTLFERYENHTKTDYLIPDAINGRYKPLATLGEGGMGVVVLAYDDLDNRLVAIKIAKSKLQRDAEERFKREAKKTREISKINNKIIEITDMGSYESSIGKKINFYYVMEYVSWPTMKDLLEERKLSIRDKVSLLMNILTALESVHNEGIVHRDLKPENIMINPDNINQFKLMDFGLVKDLQSESAELTGTSVAMGTPSYMSPEQTKSSRDVDHRADLFAMAVIGYELVTGEKPFKGDTAFQIMLAVTQTEATPPSKINPEVDDYLDAIMLRGLSKEKDERYQSAGQMIEDLQSWLDGGKAPRLPSTKVKQRVAARPAPGEVKKVGATGRRDIVQETPGARRHELHEQRRGTRHEKKSLLQNPVVLILGGAVAALIVIILVVVFGRSPSGRQDVTKPPVKTTPEGPVVVTPTPPDIKPPQKTPDITPIKPPDKIPVTPVITPTIQGDAGLYFDGTGIITIPKKPILNNIFHNGTATIDVVCKLDKTAQGKGGVIVSKDTWAIWYGGENEIWFRHSYSGKNLQYNSANLGSKIFEKNNIIVSFNVSDPNSFKLFLNGENLNMTLKSAASGTPKNDSSYDITIGDILDRQTSLKGVVSQLRIAKKDITPEMAKKMSQGDYTDFDKDAILIVKGNVEGNKAIDSSSNANHGTMSGGVKRVEGKKPGGGTIWAIKDIIAPKMEDVKYSKWVAPFVEEGIFFALPLLVTAALFGVPSDWIIPIMAIARGAFFIWHESVRGELSALRRGDAVSVDPFVAPLIIAIFGFVITLAPIATFLTVALYPISFVIAGTALAISGHLIGNLIAIRHGFATGAIGVKAKGETYKKRAPKILIGIPERLYYDLGGRKKELENIPNIVVRPISAEDKDGMLADLERTREEEACIGSALIDVEVKDAKDLPNIVKQFAREIKTNLFDLTPNMKEEVDDKKEEETDRSVTVLLEAIAGMNDEEARLFFDQIRQAGLGAIKSFDISKKSLCDLAIDNTNRSIIDSSSLTRKAKQYLTAGPSKTEPKYISVTAPTLADLRFIADTMRYSGLKKEELSGFVQVRITDKEVNENNLGEFLAKTGLDNYLERKNVIIQHETVTFSDALGLVRQTFGDVKDLSDVAIGDFDSIRITYDEEKLFLSDKAPTFIRVQGSCASSQLLLALIEIMTGNNVRIQDELGTIIKYSGYRNWYVFIPTATAIDVERLKVLIENYEKTLIAA